jgi:hypothetical protein
MLVEKKKDGRLVGFLNCPLGSSQEEYFEDINVINDLPQ